MINLPSTISRAFQSRDPLLHPLQRLKTSTLVVSGDEGQSFHWPLSWAEAWLILLESHLYPQLLDPPIPECLGCGGTINLLLTSRSVGFGFFFCGSAEMVALSFHLSGLCHLSPPSFSLSLWVYTPFKSPFLAF